MKTNTKKVAFVIYMAVIAILVITLMVLSFVKDSVIYAGVAGAFAAFASVLTLLYRRNNKD